MSQRRLFSPAIVESDAFLEMPVSTQALYFHLGMSADDDGFVNPKRIMRVIGASDDDLKVLLAKRFVLKFESGVIVIKHWLIHNSIRKDRYHETMYLDEKKTLQIKDNKAYTELWQPNGNQMEPEVKLSKVKLSNIVAIATPWNLKEHLKEMLNSKQRHIRLISIYLTRRDVSFKSAAEVSEAIKRHSKAAVSVGKFTNDKIFEAMDKCDKMEGIEWTLETVLKQLTK